MLAVGGRQLRHLLHHADRVLRAGLDAQTAEDAARVVDLEPGRVLRMRVIVGVERGVDLDHLRRAHRRAHVAGDALRPPVRPLRQHVLAAVVLRVVGAGFLGVIGRERALAEGHPLPHVPEEDAAGDAEAAEDLEQVRPLPPRERGLVPVDLAPVGLLVQRIYP